MESPLFLLSVHGSSAKPNQKNIETKPYFTASPSEAVRQQHPTAKARQDTKKRNGATKLAEKRSLQKISSGSRLSSDFEFYAKNWSAAGD